MLSRRLQFFVDLHGRVFRLYNENTETLLREIDSNDRSFDLSTLELNEGEYSLGLSYVDQYGNESERSVMRLRVGAGGDAMLQLRGPYSISARPLAGGRVQVTWQVQTNAGGRVNPAHFDVAISDAPDDVLHVVGFDGQQTTYTAALGPYAHDHTLRVLVRSSDGDENQSPWGWSNPVTADDQGPPLPAIVTASDCC